MIWLSCYGFWNTKAQREPNKINYGFWAVFCHSKFYKNIGFCSYWKETIFHILALNTIYLIWVVAFVRGLLWYNNSERARLKCGRSWVWAPIWSNQRPYHWYTGICRFSAKCAALSSKSKDGLARNQDSVSEWSEISTGGLLFQWANHITSLGLVQVW